MVHGIPFELLQVYKSDLKNISLLKFIDVFGRLQVFSPGDLFKYE